MTVKHRNGFPPNFIHSLDSSHMMLTSIYLWHEGITFASGSWTHMYGFHICELSLIDFSILQQKDASIRPFYLNWRSVFLISVFISARLFLDACVRRADYERDVPEPVRGAPLLPHSRAALPVLHRQVHRGRILISIPINQSIYFLQLV